MLTKLKPPQVEPARDGDLIMVTVPNYWAKGATLQEAISLLPHRSRKLDDYWLIYSVHPETNIDDYGSIHSLKEHRPILLCKNMP